MLHVYHDDKNAIVANQKKKTYRFVTKEKFVERERAQFTLVNNLASRESWLIELGYTKEEAR